MSDWIQSFLSLYSLCQPPTRHIPRSTEFLRVSISRHIINIKSRFPSTQPLDPQFVRVVGQKWAQRENPHRDINLRSQMNLDHNLMPLFVSLLHHITEYNGSPTLYGLHYSGHANKWRMMHLSATGPPTIRDTHPHYFYRWKSTQYFPMIFSVFTLRLNSKGIIEYHCLGLDINSMLLPVESFAFHEYSKKGVHLVGLWPTRRLRDWIRVEFAFNSIVNV